MFKFALILIVGVHIVSGQQSITLNNVIVNFLNRGSQTDFFLISNFPNSGVNVNNAWVGVGLNSNNKMVNTKKMKI